MALATYYRLSLLLPPAVAGITFVLGPTSVGVLLVGGLPFYGPGYVVFAAAMLYWLRRPRARRAMHKTAVHSPLIFAPIGAISIVLMDLVTYGTAVDQQPLAAFVSFAAICGMVGYAFSLPVTPAAFLIWREEARSSLNAA